MGTDTNLCHTDFAPAGFDAAGHMLEVIVIEKDTLQVGDDHIDGPIGGIPNVVFCAMECGNPYLNINLLK